MFNSFNVLALSINWHYGNRPNYCNLFYQQQTSRLFLSHKTRLKIHRNITYFKTLILHRDQRRHLFFYCASYHPKLLNSVSVLLYCSTDSTIPHLNSRTQKSLNDITFKAIKRNPKK